MRVQPINFVGRNVKLGKDVKIWHFAYIGDECELGDYVVVGSLAHIDYKVKVGARSRIEGLAYIPPFSVIGEGVFIGPCAVLTNDPYPPSNRLQGVVVEDGAVIGARAVVKAGVRIGKGSVVGMGSVVLRDVEDSTVVAGNPARPLYSREEFDKRRADWERGLS